MARLAYDYERQISYHFTLFLQEGCRFVIVCDKLRLRQKSDKGGFNNEMHTLWYATVAITYALCKVRNGC